MAMTDIQSVDILIVEDNPHDVELTMRALHQRKLANSLTVARDGAEALKVIFGTGKFYGRDLSRPPKVILFDLKLPKVDGLEVLARSKKINGQKPSLSSSSRRPRRNGTSSKVIGWGLTVTS